MSCALDDKTHFCRVQGLKKSGSKAYAYKMLSENKTEKNYSQLLIMVIVFSKMLFYLYTLKT